MRTLLISLAALSLSSCKEGKSYGEPPDSILTSECGVSESELATARQLVSQQQPYSSGKVGQCDLIRDDTPYVAVINPKIRSSVDAMIAREAAEKKK